MQGALVWKGIRAVHFQYVSFPAIQSFNFDLGGGLRGVGGLKEE